MGELDLTLVVLLLTAVTPKIHWIVIVSLGPILLGTMFTLLLHGILLVQCYNYYSISRSDRLWMKCTVLLLLTLECLSSAFYMYWSYFDFVSNFGNAPATEGINPIAGVSWPILTGLTAFLVQGVFAWRIHILIHKRLLTLTIMIPTTIQLLASIGTTIGSHFENEFSRVKLLQPIALVWMISEMVADAFITVSLVWYLSKNKTGMKQTDNFINKLIRLTVQTGLLTTTFSMLITVLNETEPSAVGLIFGLPLSKVYAISLMSTLNARKAWDMEPPTSVQLGSMNFSESSRMREIKVRQSVTVQSFPPPESGFNSKQNSF